VSQDNTVPEDQAALTDKYLRVLAELENLRKQHRLELARAKTDAEHRILVGVLEVIDDIERAVEHCEANPAEANQGLALTRNKARNILQAEGIEAYSAVGKTFDATLMDAITVCSTNALPPGTVVNQISRGYTRRGQLLQAAQVTVAIAPKESPDE